MNMISFKRFANTLRYRSIQVGAIASLALAGEPAFAQYGGSGGDGMFSSFINFSCQILKPLVGSNSKVVSLVFLAVLAVFVFMWWLNENKEGMMVWFFRTAMAVGILINIFTLPPLLGMASVCS
jgi:hypothetical protein